MVIPSIDIARSIHADAHSIITEYPESIIAFTNALTRPRTFHGEVIPISSAIATRVIAVINLECC